MTANSASCVAKSMIMNPDASPFEVEVAQNAEPNATEFNLLEELLHLLGVSTRR